MSEILDRSEARAKLLARYKDPTKPAFPGAVAIICDTCGKHILWVNPPLSSAPTICKECQ